MKALVIDDSRVVRLIAGRALQALGFDVTEACDGRDALDKIEAAAELPALALVDWNMPVMTGIEFVEEVRKNQAYDAIRLVMLTTETSVDHIALALSKGANEYLMKPFDEDALNEKLSIVGLKTS